MVKRKSATRFLHVLMNGEHVGVLTKHPTEVLAFDYESSWLKTPGARPISLSLPLINKTFSGDVVSHFFDNLLPDNFAIRARIKAKFNIVSDQPFDLLATIGKDCVGAIQLIEGELPVFKHQIKGLILSDKQIADSLRSYRINPLGMMKETDDFRISLAGAQEKSAFLFYNNRWMQPQGSTPTTHIFKLPIGYLPHQQMDLTDSCENEYLCALIAKAFGLPVADCEIKHFEEMKVLVVKRFDRKLSHDKKWLIRLPQEDMCQALGVSPNLKYQADGGPGIHDIMRLLLGSHDNIADREMFFRAQILFWLLAAIDGHAKNFSVFIEANGKYRLTPLYDIISAYPLLQTKKINAKSLKMAMALRGKKNHYEWHVAQRRHFLTTAKFVRFSPERAEEILDEMLEKVETVIALVKKQLPKSFPKNISEPIFEGLKLSKLHYPSPD